MKWNDLSWVQIESVTTSIISSFTVDRILNINNLNYYTQEQQWWNRKCCPTWAQSDSNQLSQTGWAIPSTIRPRGVWHLQTTGWLLVALEGRMAIIQTGVLIVTWRMARLTNQAAVNTQRKIRQVEWTSLQTTPTVRARTQWGWTSPIWVISQCTTCSL